MVLLRVGSRPHIFSVCPIKIVHIPTDRETLVLCGHAKLCDTPFQRRVCDTTTMQNFLKADACSVQDGTTLSPSPAAAK